MDERFYEMVLDTMPDLVFVKDRDLRIVYANPRFLEIYAPADRESVVGTTTIDNFLPEEAEVFMAEDRRAFEEGYSEIIEDIVDWQGASLTLFTRKQTFVDSKGRTMLLAISTDISKLSQREKTLVRVNRQLRDYAQSVAHDLRSPIASIISGVNILERDKKNVLTERSQMVAQAMKESALGMSAHLTSMLNAAQSEQKSLVFTKSDLHLLLEEARFNLFALRTSRDAVVQSTRLPVAHVEPNLFRQMLQSLIENAIRHCGVDKPVVTIRYNETEDELIFTVKDNGIGISAQKRHMLLRPFGASESDDGYGLGFAQCQRIAHLHDGFIDIPEDSQDDGGLVCVHISKHLRATPAAT